MSYYDFKCTYCEEVEEKEIPIQQYEREKLRQVCTKCGGIMQRCITVSPAMNILNLRDRVGKVERH